MPLSVCTICFCSKTVLKPSVFTISKGNIAARTANQKLLLNYLYLVVMLCRSVLYLFNLTVKKEPSVVY